MACVEPAVRTGAGRASFGVAALVGTDSETEAIATADDDVERASSCADDATELRSRALAEPASASASAASGLIADS